LTESEARVSSDMMGRLREQEMEGMASPIVQQMRFKDSVVRAKVAHSEIFFSIFYLVAND